ncbi:porin [Taibaiella chishuiensis]|uniref:Phosphate-selective porin O/P n=1 Tax=Taibaiella chishuiensis TaxID=1434707 RepID=A0A2P8D8F8_9BACT|nr:porin [Taibaiella chishuiensis]PSK93515.1 phosphate-selective porin O/P [Taibaiella chishuiensis]
MRKHYRLFIAILFAAAGIARPQLYAQEATVAADTPRNFSAFKRSVSFSGLLQTRYVASLSRNVDVNGVNFNQDTKDPVTNAFFVKRARVMIKANVNDHFSANFMVNFAEFSSNPINKVLENAYIKYTLNRHLNVQAGQFRPFFGIEDAVPVDLIRTMDYSNQYYTFGANGWQSFQIGVTVFGDITADDENPMRYYVGGYNGNNRNQASDNDDTKNFYARLEKKFLKSITVGLNAGTGSSASATGNAWGGDVSARIDLSKKWKLLLMAEYKSGTNFTAFHAAKEPDPRLGDYRMRGFYFFPILRFEYKAPRVRAIEFSTRYEHFNESFKKADNPRQTLIPNLSLIFADDFFATLQVGTAIDLYKTEIPLTATYNHSLLYVQLQCRF